MPHRKMRRLVVDGVTYLWIISHKHNVLPTMEPPTCRCREVLTAYREGFKSSPLKVRFTGGPGVDAGYPESGTVHVWGPPNQSYNLNTPGLAAIIIRRAIAMGWTPDSSRQPFELEDGLRLISEEKD